MVRRRSQETITKLQTDRITDNKSTGKLLSNFNNQSARLNQMHPASIVKLTQRSSYDKVDPLLRST